MAENIKNKIETDCQYLVARYEKYLVRCDEDAAWRVKKQLFNKGNLPVIGLNDNIDFAQFHSDVICLFL